MNKLLLITLSALAITMGGAQAQSSAPAGAAYSASISAPFNSPLDSRVKYYAYNADVVYTLPITVGMHTHIQLAADEVLIEKPKLGETIQWRITGNEHNLYIKALQPNTSTSLTLVTDKRSYQFEIVSTTESSKRIQKAYFTYPDDDEKMELTLLSQIKEKKGEGNRLDSLKVAPSVDPAQLNFNYTVTGTAAFKPSAVYDDGKFTYFRLPATQDLPAIFMLEDGSRNKLSPINYAVKGDQIIIERLAKNFVMKLGKEELRIAQGK
jgi:type IV secretion system protein TrbG